MGEVESYELTYCQCLFPSRCIRGVKCVKVEIFHNFFSSFDIGHVIDFITISSYRTLFVLSNLISMT